MQVAPGEQNAALQSLTARGALAEMTRGQRGREKLWSETLLVCIFFLQNTETISLILDHDLVLLFWTMDGYTEIALLGVEPILSTRLSDQRTLSRSKIWR